ncbi:ROK family protein [Endozoicomonas arenosclerae]|uniref:ROK family protein n=1 Tax=Endozoicomonas arenosclerae TaxID=1633495 RepID=UPI000B16A8A2|nr:ROK family protein [Endozoicomonas arenosclerae]
MYLSIDLGGTYVKYGVLDEQGNIRLKDKFPTPQGEIETLYGEIGRVFDQVSNQFDIQGLAISAPGAVTDHGVINGVSAIPCIHGPNIREDLESRFNVPVAMENDANCAALAEVRAGSAKGYDDVLFVVCGTGVGGAVIKDGQLHKGKNLLGGEFGMLVQYDHKQNRMESFSWLASTGNMVRRASEQLNRELTGQDVFELAAAGNQICQQEVDAFYAHLALLLTNLQCVYDPQLIVVSGGVTERSQFGDELGTALESINKMRDSLSIETDVAVAQHRNDANLLGAFFNLMDKIKIQGRCQ